MLKASAVIDPLYVRAWSHEQVTRATSFESETDPELASNEEWRGDMFAARKARGLTQGALGEKVGTSQNMISNIESGHVVTSRFIRAIGKELGIGDPLHFATKEEERWWRLGRALRLQNDVVWRNALKMVEAMVEAIGSQRK